MRRKKKKGRQDARRKKIGRQDYDGKKWGDVRQKKNGETRHEMEKKWGDKMREKNGETRRGTKKIERRDARQKKLKM